MTTWLFVWCALSVSSGTEKICLDDRWQIYDSSQLALVAYDALDREKQKGAYLWQGIKWDIAPKYELKLSSGK